MKKIYIILFMLTILILYPVKCQASSLLHDGGALKYAEKVTEDFIISGYTESGIYYEVYGTGIEGRALEGVYVTRTVIFEGDIMPDSTLHWKEYINGIAYSGTLSLIEYAYKGGVTKAVYEGTLYKKIE